MSKEIYYKQGGIEYELGGGLGSWAQSHEDKVNKGDVRVIGKKLMYVYSIYYKGIFGKPEVNWIPVDYSEKKYLFSEITEWIDSL